MANPVIFTGKVDLSDIKGIIYNTVTQTAPISITVGSRKPKGWALLPIITNGTAITIPNSWIKYGGDDIATSGTNHLHIFYRDENIVYYTNKVV